MGSLAEALDVRRGDMIAFTGGGGKTSAVLVLSRELRDLGWRVLASTTTRVGATLARELPVTFASGDAALDEAARALERSGAVFLASGHTSDGKLAGLRPEVLDLLSSSGVAHAVLVEADGSRQRPVKAPAPHEPVVPAGTSILSFMVGVDALGEPLDGPMVHRPELVRAFGTGLDVSPALLGRLVTSEGGGLKGLPPGAAARPILNRVGARRDDAAAVAERVLRLGRGVVDRVLLTDLRERLFFVATRSA